ncbi:MAG: outer membrane protein assembly factor [Gammaproteobacteria bacterium]|nr:outer membrane protein assembly factor [Gammaproteobacteria bacterium]MBL6998957.1 outer membrane protein assembly factor [Gammaproteobacteria bacterium]
MFKARALWLLCLLLFSHSVWAQVLVKVDIPGLEKKLEDNVRLFLSIEQQKDHALMSEGRLRRLHKKAPQEIEKALQPFGYYHPNIESSLTQSATDQWQAQYNIDPGLALPVAEFNFTLSEEMSNDPEFQQLIETLPFSKGKAFNHLRYEDFKSSLAKLASERGYFNARFIEHRVEIDLKAYSARIHLNYDGGSRFRYGEVLLQQDVLNPELLKRYVTFKSGEPYLVNQLIDLQQALNDSDYFQSVEVSPGELKRDSHEVPINVLLTPRKRHRYSFGLGYGTDTGARTKFGWEIPRYNEDGHRINTDIKISEIGYSLGAHYRVPILNPRTDQMVYSAGRKNEITDTSDSTVSTIGASLKHSRGEWRESISLNYQQEDFVVGDDFGQSYLLIPGINWSRTWGRNFIYTLDGLRFNLGWRGASKELLSDTDFSQLQGSVKTITSLSTRNRIITRGSLGTTWTNDFEQLPSSVRFFAGGAQSVRGYTYQSLGPVNASDQVIGGKHLMVGSIEFEHSFNGKWGLALFYDAGNAIDSLGDKLERGAGFGMRWKSPIGPVRIDLASAISEDGQPWRLHINIGPDL